MNRNLALWALAPLVLLGVAPLVLFVLIGEWVTPSVGIPPPLRWNAFALAALSAMVVAMPARTLAGASARTVLKASTGTLPGSPAQTPFWTLARARPRGLARWRGRIGMAVGGGLLGAAAVAPLAALPWLVVPALVFLWYSRERGGRVERLSVGVLIPLIGFAVNLAVVSATMARGLRISPDDFAAQDFRVNTLLSDVPLHDVWAIELGDRGAATLEEVAGTVQSFSPFQGTPALLLLGLVRELLGAAFGWDHHRWDDEEASYIHRLTEAEHQRSTPAPGTRLGSWRLVYAFPDEAVVELINGTVHVAVACTIGEEATAPLLYLAFRVREVNWSTSVYMGLIDPFRRYFVYPPLLRQFAYAWQRGR